MVKSRGNFHIAIKSAGNDTDALGEFDGVLSTKNETDLAGEMTSETTFANTLKEKGDKRVMLWNHNGSEPIGSLTLSDNAKTLDVHGKICMETARGKEAFALLKSGDIPLGLSIGYVVRKSHFDADGVRVLDDVDLLEGSIVSTPCCQSAMIDLASVKSSDKMASRFATLSFLKDLDEDERNACIKEIEDIIAQEDEQDEQTDESKEEEPEKPAEEEPSEQPAEDEKSDDEDDAEEEQKAFDAIVKQINAITAKLR